MLETKKMCAVCLEGPAPSGSCSGLFVRFILKLSCKTQKPGLNVLIIDP